MYLVSFLIGLIIVISSIFLIRREFNQAVRSQKMLLDQSKVYKEADLFELLEGLQLSIDEMNRAFYDIADDLEGKYSIHEKEIRLLEEAILDVKKAVAKLSSTKKTNDIPTQTPLQMSSKERIEHMNEISVKAKGESVNVIETSIDAVDAIENRSESDLIDRIIALRSQGKQLPQIAKELGIGMGELQLLISLKK